MRFADLERVRAGLHTTCRRGLQGRRADTLPRMNAELPAITIARRFCGPPHSANGGYAAGRAAEAFASVFDQPPTASVRVDLRAPPPLEVELGTERASDPGPSLLVVDGEGQTIALAQAGQLALELVSAPSIDEARAASEHYVGFEAHPYGTCFVCGPTRDPGDGLRIFPGRRGAEGPVFSPWTPSVDLVDGDDAIPAHMMWAALDCPGYFGVAEVGELALLARMTARVQRVPAVGEPLVVAGWSLGREGRKLNAATAVFDAEGAALAWSQQLWIKVDKLPGT